MGSSLVWRWPMIMFQPSSSAHLSFFFFLVWGKMPQEKKKDISPLLLSMYHRQLLCEVLDLSNQTQLSVRTSNTPSTPSHEFSPTLKGALIFLLTTWQYGQRHAYYFMGCDLYAHVKA